MKVTHYEEHKDGSATVHLDINLEEQQKLIEVGLITLLGRYVEETTDE